MTYYIYSIYTNLVPPLKDNQWNLPHQQTKEKILYDHINASEKALTINTHL